MLITAQLKDGSITVLPMTVETLVLLRKHGQISDTQLEGHLVTLRTEAESCGQPLDETPVSAMRASLVESWMVRMTHYAPNTSGDKQP